jgi:ParB family chromosome partitioning protein
MENEPAVPAEPIVAVSKIPVDQIKPSPYQARKYFDEDQLQLLALTMKETGLEQPITVRLMEDGSYQLIAGERRLRAAKLLGWSTIEVIVRTGVTDQTAALKGLIENLQRADLNPIEEARGYRQLTCDPYKLTHEAIAGRVGKSRAQVTEAISLLNLPEEIQQIVERSTISPGHGDALLRLPTPGQQIEMANQVVQNGWSVKETEKRVNQQLGKSASPGNKAPSPSGRGTGLPKGEADPLAAVWGAIRQNSGLNPNSWQVSYRGSHEWAFQASAKEVDLTADPDALKRPLAKWFGTMADALDAHSGQSPEVDLNASLGTVPRSDPSSPVVPTQPPSPRPLHPESQTP